MSPSDKFFTLETQSEKVDCTSHPGQSLSAQTMAQHCQKRTCQSQGGFGPSGISWAQVLPAGLEKIFRSLHYIYSSDQNVGSHQVAESPTVTSLSSPVPQCL